MRSRKRRCTRASTGDPITIATPDDVGTSGQVLTSNGLGGTLWGTPDPPQDLQDTYTNSVSSTIVTDSTRNAIVLQQGSGADTDNVLEVLNGAGTTTTAAVRGDGQFTSTALVAPTLDSSGGTGVIIESTIDIGVAAQEAIKIAGAMHLTHTATIPGDHGVHLTCDAAGFEDVKALDLVYRTGALPVGNEEDVVLASIDESAAVGGEISAFCAVSTEGAATVQGLKCGAVINPVLQIAGAFADPSNDFQYEDGGTQTVAPAALSGATVFDSTNDWLEVRNTAVFTELEFLMSSASSKSISPKFEFWNGSSFTAFGPVDGTNGMLNNGAVLWQATDVVGWTASAGAYILRVTREENKGLTSPVYQNNGIKIVEGVEYGWDKDAKLSIANVSCTGKIFADETRIRIGENSAADGDNSIAIGAGAVCGTGVRNVMIGRTAGGAPVTGPDNIALGEYALNNLTSGGCNVAIGQGTALGIKTTTDNVCIGTNANSTNGNKGIAIGFSASVTGGGGIAIGNNASAGSNICKIGGAGLTNIAADTGATCNLGATSSYFHTLYLANKVKIDGTDVLGAQGAAIADATDAASVILRLNDLLAAVRTHGLIAT